MEATGLKAEGEVYVVSEDLMPAEYHSVAGLELMRRCAQLQPLEEYVSLLACQERKQGLVSRVLRNK